MLQMEAMCRCLRGLGTVSAVALQGARTPNWPAQPAIQPPMRHESNAHKLYRPYLLLVLNYVKYNLTIFKLHFVLVMMKCQFLFHFYFSQIFCDFGENFTVVDTNGEQPISNMISSVSKVTQKSCIKNIRNELQGHWFVELAFKECIAWSSFSLLHVGLPLLKTIGKVIWAMLNWLTNNKNLRHE